MPDLHELIASAVARELLLQSRDCGEYQTRDSYKVAGAVIASLNLRTDQVGTLTRYVTEWTTNE